MTHKLCVCEHIHPVKFFLLAVALVRVSAFFRCFRRGRTSFFSPPKKFFLLVLNTIQVEPGALRAPGRGPPAELSRLTVFRETQQVSNSRYEILENKAWRVVE